MTEHDIPEKVFGRFCTILYFFFKKLSRTFIGLSVLLLCWDLIFFCMFCADCVRDHRSSRILLFRWKSSQRCIFAEKYEWVLRGDQNSSRVFQCNEISNSNIIRFLYTLGRTSRIVVLPLETSLFKDFFALNSFIFLLWSQGFSCSHRWLRSYQVTVPTRHGRIWWRLAWHFG